MKRLKFDSPKREAIRKELEADPARSDNMIAKICGCTNKTVTAVRYQMPNLPAPNVRQCADGVPRRRPKRLNPVRQKDAILRAWDSIDDLIATLRLLKVDRLAPEDAKELKTMKSISKKLFSRF